MIPGRDPAGHRRTRYSGTSSVGPGLPDRQPLVGVGRFAEGRAAPGPAATPLSDTMLAVRASLTNDWEVASVIALRAGMSGPKASAALRELHRRGMARARTSTPMFWRAP